MSYLSVKNLSLEINGTKILDDISFSVAKGELLCLIGQNGAGKSTLLNCVGRLAKNYTGSVMLDGEATETMSAKNVARKISWVLQGSYGSLPYTVRDFAKMSRYPWHGAFDSHDKNDERIVEEALETAGVVSLAERKLNSLSGGERQRALIAAALAQDTELLCLDEPTSYLDYKHQTETLDLIRLVNKEKKKTVLLVTHDINLALCCADRIMAIRKGKIIMNGSTEQLMQGNALREIFDTEFVSFSSEGQKFPYVAPRGIVR